MLFKPQPPARQKQPFWHSANKTDVEVFSLKSHLPNLKTLMWTQTASDALGASTGSVWENWWCHEEQQRSIKPILMRERLSALMHDFWSAWILTAVTAELSTLLLAVEVPAEASHVCKICPFICIYLAEHHNLSLAVENHGVEQKRRISSARTTNRKYILYLAECCRRKRVMVLCQWQKCD